MTFTTKIIWQNEIQALKESGLRGETYQVMGDRYGVSRERIRQVLRRYIPNWNEVYGMDARRYKRIRDEGEERFIKWGNKEDSDLYRSQRAKFRAKKANAIRTGWPWEIDFGDLEWPINCPVLGMALDYFSPVRKESSPSFDQVEPGGGYAKGNVRIISWRANRIKSDGSADEHHKVAEWLDSLK